MRKAIVAILGLLLLGSLFSQVAFAHFTASPYIYRSQTFAQADPVNLVFYGNAYWGNVEAHLSHHMGWNFGGGDLMYFIDHGNFWPMDDQRASDQVWTPYNRYHMRLKQGFDADPYWGVYTQAAVHEDIVVLSCIPESGHAGAQFNNLRDNVAGYFNLGDPYGHPYQYFYEGNTNPSPQCDGTMPSSDGWVAWIRIP